MKDFRNLKVWQKAHLLTLAIYRISLEFPKVEMYQLTSQIRGSSSSIPTNIAEGCGRETDADFKRFLQIAYGSSSELDYQLLLAHDLGYLPSPKYQELYSQLLEVQKMLHRFIQKLKNDN